MREKQVTLGIISHERISRFMSGPSIRSWELARSLANDARVILLSPESSDAEPEGFELVTYTRDTLVSKLEGCDAILCQGFIINNHPEIKELGAAFIVDLYVPLTLEALAQYGHLSINEQRAIQGSILISLMEQLSVGSFFICASDRQWDYWLGMLSAAGRIMPEIFEKDATFQQLMGLVPFGLPDNPPVATGKALKGVHEAVGVNDRVLLWGGGIYNWFDPFTPIRAMEELAQRRDDVKLFFLSTGHPNPGVPKMRASDEAIALSRDLGLFGGSVIFNDKWVDYHERANFLLEADIGVYANVPHVETRFSFRTRVLDCIWARLPLVATEGDALSEMVGERGLGLVVPSGDGLAFADAVERLLDDADLRARCRENLAVVGSEFKWSLVTEPIRNFLNRLAAGEVEPPVVHRLGMANLGAEIKDLERRLDELQWVSGMPRPFLRAGAGICRRGRLAARGIVRAGRSSGHGAQTTKKNITDRGNNQVNDLVKKLHKWHFFDAVRITRKGTEMVLKEGPFSLLDAARLRWRDPLQYQYSQWLKNHTVLPSDYQRMAAEVANFDYQPLISIIVPVYNLDPVWLQKCVDSVTRQVYRNWELCIVDDASARQDTLDLLRYLGSVDTRIKVSFMEQNQGISGATNQALQMASGEFIGLLDSDDELAPEALFEVVKVLNEDPQVDFIYSDEDKLTIKGQRCEPFFKPDWSPDLMYSHMYTCHFGVYRREIAEEIGGFRKEFDGSQDYDFVLRFTERTNKVRHIPKILYHWRKIPGSGAERYDAKNTDDVSQNAIQEAVDRTGGGKVEKGLRLGTFRVRRPITGSPLVSIIIPCRDRSDLTKQCIDSIWEKTTWNNYEILVVDNNSSEKAALAYLEGLRSQPDCRVLSFDAPYNFSAINNMASREASGEVLVFANNDIEVITPDWLEAMLELAQQPDVGAVGPMLLYPDNTIQHAGVILGVGGVSNHAFYRTDPGAYSYFNQANVIRNFAAVTGACMMVRKEVYEEMGGLDEKNCPIDYNDIDFGLRLWKSGYRVVYTPFATLYHHEGATLGLRENPEYTNTKFKGALSQIKQKKIIAGGDGNAEAKQKKIIAGGEEDPEAQYMMEQWGGLIANDPFYNPNLARNRFDFSLRLRD